MRPEIELSIVIPTLNEEDSILRTLENLSAQKEVRLEVIISDGGSVDDTCAEARKSRLAISTISGVKGRAAQLNAGATKVKGDFILFLHADCCFSDDYALRKGIEALRAGSLKSEGKQFAGHFGLKFSRSINTPSLAYSYFESKAKIDREGCAHGDQGILISACHFKQTGGFDESDRILAETRFADRLRRMGEWLLLPSEITNDILRRYSAADFRQYWQQQHAESALLPFRNYCIVKNTDYFLFAPLIISTSVTPLTVFRRQTRPHFPHSFTGFSSEVNPSE